MVLYRLPILILLMSLLYIYVLPEEPATFKFVFQFIPMILILLHAIRLAPRNKHKAHYFILAGLIISFIADATSVWPIISLTAFAIVQLCFTSGFLLAKTKKKLPLLPFVALIIIYISVCTIYLNRALYHTEQGYLFIPVLIYIVLLAITFLTATRTRNSFAISGSLLFTFAHTILLWHVLIQPINYIEPIVMLSYYGAQFLIATSLGEIVRGAKSIVW